jgi:hypothetical protein
MRLCRAGNPLGVLIRTRSLFELANLHALNVGIGTLETANKN